jgi:YD repeat-containing protein
LRELRGIDAFGNIVSTTDRAGITTTTDYDATGRVTRLGTPKGDSVAWNDTTIGYDLGPVGAQFGGYASRTITRHGNMQENVYHDALGRSALVHRYVWDTSTRTSTRFAYDWRGATVFASYPMEGELHRDAITKGIYTEFDGLGRPVKTERDSELGRLIGTATYLQGAGIRRTDPKGAATTTRYQVLDTPDHGGIIEVAAPEGVQQSIVRDAFGLPRQIAQYGAYEGSLLSQTRHYIYDEFRRLCRTIDPESQSSVVDYDAGNRPLWSAQGIAVRGMDCGRDQVPAGAKTSMSYDTMNRVTAVTHADGSASSTFGYDAVGRVVQANSGITEWSYAYNALGLPTRETLAVEGLNFGLAYGYDANGSLTNTVYPDGRNVDYAPDGLGRPSKAGPYASTARYHPNGELAYFKYGNGIEYLSEQNARLAPGNLSYAKPGGELLFSQDLTYDVNSLLTNISDLVSGSTNNREFIYDALGRLINAKNLNLWNTESFTYDPLNNIRTISNGLSQKRTYLYDSTNKISSIHNPIEEISKITYDSRGNTIDKGSASFSFNLANSLVEVKGKESYAYDAYGRRVLKTRLGSGGAKTYYVYSHRGSLMVERHHESSAADTDYIYLGNKLVSQIKTYVAELPGAIWFSLPSPTNGAFSVYWGGIAGSRYELDEQYNGGPWTGAYRGTSTGHGFFSPRSGGTYIYRVRACAILCSAWVMSSPMGVTLDVGTTVTVPTGIQKGPYSVQWAPAQGAVTYDVEESRDGAWWTTVATATHATSVERPGTTIGSYVYRVLPRNEYGGRRWSPDSAVVTVDPIDRSPPPAPVVTSPRTETVMVPNYPTSIDIFWNEQPRATHYEVKGSNGYSCSTDRTTCKDINIRSQGTYIYDVRSCNNYGCSAWRQSGWIHIYARGEPLEP